MGIPAFRSSKETYVFLEQQSLEACSDGGWRIGFRAGCCCLLGVVYSDAVLLPILAGFLILTGYAIWRQKTQK